MPSPINKAYSAPPGAVLRVGFVQPSPAAELNSLRVGVFLNCTTQKVQAFALE